MHGAWAGAPLGNRNALKHGARSAETIGKPSSREIENDGCNSEGIHGSCYCSSDNITVVDHFSRSAFAVSCAARASMVGVVTFCQPAHRRTCPRRSRRRRWSWSFRLDLGDRLPRAPAKGREYGDIRSEVDAIVDLIMLYMGEAKVDEKQHPETTAAMLKVVRSLESSEPRRYGRQIERGGTIAVSG